jgi:YD repeat-containing protein
MVAIITGTGTGLERSSAWVLGSRGQLGSSGLGRDNEGVYVNAAKGNLVITRQDEFLIGLGPDISVDRTYNSQAVAGVTDGDNDDQWRMGVYRRIIGSHTDSTIKRIDWDGSDVVFVQTGTDSYRSTEQGGSYDLICWTPSSNQWTWMDGKTRVVENYDSTGKLLNTIDPDGNTLTYTYTGALITRVTDQDGEYTSLTYNGSNQLTQLVTTKSGGATLTRVRYAYDGSNRLSTVTVDLSPDDSLVTDGKTYVTTYSYDGSSKRVASISQTDGSYIAFTYVQVGADYKVASYTQSVATGVTRTTSFDYSVAGRTTVIDPAGQKTFLWYNGNNELLQISYPPDSAGTTPRVVQFAYNANGDVVSTTLGPGNVIVYEYDGNGNLTKERDSAGNTVARTYGSKNELLTETRYLVADPDGPGSGQPTTPLTTRYAYDGENHLRYVVSAEGFVTRYEYDAPGQQTAAIEYAGNAYNIAGIAENVSIAEGTLTTWAGGLDKTTARRTETLYDFRGGITTVTSYSKMFSDGSPDTSSERTQTNYLYDQYGNLLSRLVTGAAAGEVFTYDGLGRTLTATDAVGGLTRSTFFDATGQTVLTHANGLSEISTYNKAGELIAVSQSNAGGNLVDTTGWPGNPGAVPAGQATLPGWPNYSAYADETQWASTMGPDGLQVVAMRAGQLDTSEEGGGAYTPEIAIDASKAYEFTWQFKLSAMDKHYVFFGLSGGASAYVENLSDGVDNGNPYFWYAYPGMQDTYLDPDKWYKVVGYVLPQGTPTSSAPLGGVYDVATGQKVLDLYLNFRWNPERPGNTVHSRFFDYYGTNYQDYSTYFLAPEVRQVSTATVLGPDTATSLYRYDNLGRLRMTIDPTGRRNYMMYDSIGRKVADIDADGSATEYRYDGNDNVTSTTRYFNKINVGDLFDGNGELTVGAFATRRPATHADDQWTFQVYDNAQRLVQTIDGTGATTTYAYDGLSRVTTTKTYANRLDSGTLNYLKGLAINSNRWNLDANGLPLGRYNLSAASAGTIDGANAYQLTVGALTDWQAIYTDGMAASPGQTVTATITVKAVGSLTMDYLGLYGGTDGWGPDSDSYAAIVSGPGQLTYQYGGLFLISGLSTTEATRFTVTRTYHLSEWAGPYFYLGNSAVVQGWSTIIAAPVFSSTPSSPILPTADASNDRVSRSFYDNDGRLIAAMDAAGGLSKFEYDKGGRKVREFNYSKAVASGLRASGTLAELIASAGTSTADRRTDYVYDGRGYLRFTLNAMAAPTEYVYDGAGRVIRTVAYSGTIAAVSSYSLAYVQAQLTSTGLATSAYNRISRSVYDAAGQLAFAIDAAGAVTAFAYDGVGNAVKTTRYAILYTTAGDQSLATMQSWAAGQASQGANRIDRTIYDVHGRVAYAVDAEGFVTEHRYDAAGRLTKDIRYSAAYSVADGATRESLAALIGALPATAVVVNYAYDADGLLSDVTLVTDNSTGAGTVTRNAYDSFGQLTDITVAYGSADASTTHRTYDTVGRVLNETRGYGSATTATTAFAYDAVGNLVAITDPLNYVTARSYDAVGRLLSVSVPVDADPGNNLVTANEYDALGDLVRVTDARGASSYNYYDSIGRLIWQVDRGRYVTRNDHNAFNELAAVTRYATPLGSAPAVGTPPSPTTGAGDATTSFAYDLRGQLSAVVDAVGAGESYSYTVFGERGTAYNKLGGRTDYVYDKLGRRTYEYVYGKAYRADGTIQQDGFYNSLFQYDSRGNVIRRYDALALTEQRETDYVYDKANRLIQTAHDLVATIGADLQTVTNLYPQEFLTYNLRGDLIRSVDAAGGTTTFYYDTLGRKTDEVSAVGTLSHWTYDGNGNVLTARVYGDAVAIPASPLTGPPAPVNAGNYRQTSYGYDRANRRITSTVAALQTGIFIGGAYNTTFSGDVTTQIYYDKNGNVWAAADGAGNVTWTWYDALDRKIAQIDAENYLSCWTLDGNGNATTETRYATKITGSFSGTTAATALPALAGTSAADRTTNFTYDKNGRRLTETRLGVAASTVSGLSVSTSTVSATITYTYNGLGQVLTKTEANGDLTQYEYDNLGRLTKITEAPFVDFMGSWIRPVTDLRYDGLGNLVRSVARGDTNSYTPDRVTTNSYGADGRLAATTDANGFVRSFGYDRVGRVVKESWSRLKSDGTTSVTEAIGYRYDLAGRLVTQAAATWNGSAFVFGDATRIRYNAYGEVSGRGITAGPDVTAVYQETFDYDAGGRLWRSNSGDGVIKILFYDKAGNATLTLTSTGADLSGQTYAGALATLTSAGATTIANAVTTIAVYDKRGLQIQLREPDRQLTSSTSQTILTSQAYNAFGEALSETDARGYTTDYSYNAMGRMIEKKSPSVNWTSESGAVAAARPTETYYYDVSGRLVGVRNANNALTTRVLENGTGHGDAEAAIHIEYHADGGTVVTWHNVFGDARVTVNEVGGLDIRGYDNMGRVTEVDHPGGLLNDYYTYDGLGRVTRHFNNFLGGGNVERTDYDVQGRVVSQVAFGGDTVTHAYTWYSYLSSGDLGAFGAWEDIATYANGRTTIDDKDYFGRTVWRRDMGVRVYTLTFDRAGRTTSQNVGGETLTFSYFNTGLTASISNGAGSSTGYGYDAAGNETLETTTRNYVLVQSATATFDALGRMASWAEAGNGTLTSGSPPASMAWEYDLNSNIRRTTGSYRSLDAQGTANGAAFTHDNWYRYDSMNRVTVEKGVLSGGQIVGGIAYSYDAAGRRATVTQTITRTKPLSKYIPALGNHTPRYYDEHANIVVPDDGTGAWSNVTWTFSATEVETYGYTADGYLSTVSIAVQDLAATGDYGTTNPHADTIGASQLRSSHSYDAMGRETRQIDWIGNGTDAAFDRTVTYNAKGQVETEITVSKQIEAGATTPSLFGNETTNYYGSGSGYDLGSLEHSVTTNKKDNVVKATVTTTDTYSWWNGPEQATINIVTDNVSGTDTNYTTTNSYTASGQLASASIADGRARTVTFVTNMAGEIIRRDEADGNGSAGDPHEIWYRYGGRQLGYVGNNGTLDTDYLTSIDNRMRTPPTNPNAFLFGSATAVSYADFSQALNPVNSYAQGSDAGSYTVRAGETLESIARNLWGDSSLWYQLASANGLSGPGSPGEGRTLAIPANAMSNAHNASTFRPYDPAKAIGDISPTNPKPSKKAGGGCGMIGAIILVVIAVAVSAVVAPWATGIIAGQGASVIGGIAAAALGGAIGGAAGAIASQAVGLATGMQSKFDWKGVALGALGGAIGGGLGKFAALSQAGSGLNGAAAITGTLGKVGNFLGGSGFISGAARGLLSSALTQGIGVATGLQKKFDWAGVAGAAIGGGVGNALGAQSLAGHMSLGNIMANVASSSAGAIANASARSLIDGSDFGDNLMAALPDVIGSTIGNMLIAGVRASGSRSVARMPWRLQLASADPSGPVTDQYLDTCPRDVQQDRCIQLTPMDPLLLTADQINLQREQTIQILVSRNAPAGQIAEVQRNFDNAYSAAINRQCTALENRFGDPSWLSTITGIRIGDGRISTLWGAFQADFRRDFYRFGFSYADSCRGQYYMPGLASIDTVNSDYSILNDTLSYREGEYGALGGSFSVNPSQRSGSIFGIDVQGDPYGVTISGIRIGESGDSLAFRQLSAMQASVSGAHFLSRHGAGTTLEQQYVRATTGLTPDNHPGDPFPSSRFYSNEIQLQAARQAEDIYRQTGNPRPRFDMGFPAGEGYMRGGGPVVTTSVVQAVFRHGGLYTLYPDLRH